MWTMVALFAAFFAWSAVANVYFVYLQLRNPHAPSVSPFVGGILGAIAVLVAPIATPEQRAIYALLPLLLDVGCVPFLLGFPWRAGVKRGHAPRESS